MDEEEDEDEYDDEEEEDEEVSFLGFRVPQFSIVPCFLPLF